MSALCPYHEEIKEGDVALCRVNACSLQDNCPYEDFRTFYNAYDSVKNPILFCHGSNGKFHKPIYYPTGGDYECPLCREFHWEDARAKIQIKLRDKLREKILNQEQEIKRLKEVVLMNHEEMEKLRSSVEYGKDLLRRQRKEINEERARRNQVEDALRGIRSDLNDVVERHTAR